MSLRRRRDRLIAVRARGPLVMAGMAAGYLALAQLVLWVNDPVGAGAGVWPAAGLTLAALLLLPTRMWVWALAGVAAAELGGNLAHGYPLAASLGWTLGNVAGPLVGATLVRRSGNRSGALVPLRRLLGFLAFAVVAGPVVGSAIGSMATVYGVGELPISEVWPKYVVGDALGVLIVAPVLLTLGMRTTRRPWRETAPLALGALAVSVAAFSEWSGPLERAAAYLLIPFFTWAALRYGPRGTALLSLGVAVVSVGFATRGEGPFTTADIAGEPVTVLQAFLGVTVGSALVLAALVSELSDRDQVADALRRQARLDPLTGLPNRAALAQALAAGQTSCDRATALLVCDIDHLKAINDTLGHRAGDLLIRRVAGRIVDSVRPQDLVTRISGDEFVVLVREVGEDRVREMCGRIMDAVARPVTLGAHAETTPTLSIGVAIGARGMSGEDVFTGADTALYEAKRLGRGRVVVYDDGMRTEAEERVAIETDLPAALAARRIHCAHQPEVDLATGELFGFESLARWHHAERGWIPPDRFVPAVEATGNAGVLFASILEQTLEAQGRWAERLGFRPAVAVNLSALQLRDPNLASGVAAALERAGAPADTLWLELTETAAADDSAAGALRALSALGVRLALDDFGTGWSSMSRLSAFRWDVIKLDRTFVAPLGTDPGAEHVVRAMIVMAHALGIRVVAEGVETAEQLARLRALDCDIAQGHLFGRPVDEGRAGGMVDADGLYLGAPGAQEGEVDAIAGGAPPATR